MSQPRRVFFSYPQANRAFATRLAKSLEEQGLELDTLDPETPAVRNGLDRLEKQVLSADAVVLLINSRSKFDELQQRIWQAVLGAAWKNRKLPIIPVLLRDAELPPFIRSAAAGNDVQAIRIHDPNDLGSITRAILENLGGSVSSSPSSSSPSHTKLPGTVAVEDYASFTEEDRKERLERLAALQEYVEQLKR